MNIKWGFGMKQLSELEMAQELVKDENIRIIHLYDDTRKVDDIYDSIKYILETFEEKMIPELEDKLNEKEDDLSEAKEELKSEKEITKALLTQVKKLETMLTRREVKFKNWKEIVKEKKLEI